MLRNGVFRRRNLPHWDVENKPVFVTARLFGTLPGASWQRVQEHRAELAWKAERLRLSPMERERWRSKRLFQFIDELLDAETPNPPLTDPRLAPLVESAMRHFDGVRYDLLSYTIMPSHLHWLFRPLEPWALRAVNESRTRGRERTPREIITHSLQSYTATQCNRVLGRRGCFWQAEAYDHWVRDEPELARIIAYIEQNPVRARLCAQPTDWPWTMRRP
ncbi:MAG: hypothetical protein U0939_15110 [Pirellulales bacterium]